MNTATVAVVQTNPTFGAIETNSAQILEAIADAAADLVVLPELATTGYVFESAAELEALAESTEGPTVTGWSRVARETDSWIVGGFAEAAGGTYYNSAAVVSPDGLEGVYRKTHLWNEEKRWFEPGSQLPVFETPFGRLGVQICNDCWFPEATITQARAGADLIAVPTNWIPDPGLERRPAGLTMGVHLAIANANAHRVFVACADRWGVERGQRFEGQSVIVGPNGDLRCGPASAERTQTVRVTCDLARARTKQLTDRDDALADRRPELYDLES